MLIPKPLILQLSKQLMVRNSHAHSCSSITNINQKNFLMPADTNTKSPEPIQPNVEKDVGTSSAVPSPQPELLPKKVLCPPHIHLIINLYTIPNKTPFVHM